MNRPPSVKCFEPYPFFLRGEEFYKPHKTHLNLKGENISILLLASLA
jgi:hypothetical protein